MNDLTRAEPEANLAGNPPRPGIAPEQWVETHGDYLFRHAQLRVRDPGAAEDLVQETFLAGWRSRSEFAGRSSERTWLLGILKHKIASFYRQKARQMETADENTLAELEAAQFKRSGFGGGHWSRSGAPGRWPNPARSLEQAEFWQVVHRCIGKLPEKLAGVFLRREMDECETATICGDLKITPANLSVMLHRARLALRRCLEANWFTAERLKSGRTTQ